MKFFVVEPEMDKFVIQVLEQDLDTARQSLKKLKKKKKLQDFEKIDLAETMQIVQSLMDVLKYYGVNNP